MVVRRASYFGIPASRASSASIIEAPGSFSDGFRTKVLPVVQAMGNIHSGIMAGKLKGQMPAHTCKQRVNDQLHSSNHEPPAPDTLWRIKSARWQPLRLEQGPPHAPLHCCPKHGEVLTPRGCRMLYVSMPLDTFSMNSPLRSTARLHAYSTTSAQHKPVHVWHHGCSCTQRCRNRDDAHALPLSTAVEECASPRPLKTSPRASGSVFPCSSVTFAASSSCTQIGCRTLYSTDRLTM